MEIVEITNNSIKPMIIIVISKAPSLESIQKFMELILYVLMNPYHYDLVHEDIVESLNIDINKPIINDIKLKLSRKLLCKKTKFNDL